MAISQYNRELVSVFKKFNSPMDIQLFLNSLKYNKEITCKPPRQVLKERNAHCFEGSIFAAAALKYMGYKPLIMNLISHEDDDHVIALFRKNGYWGAITKSNTTTLRYREAVYRTIRELALSYFDFFFNKKGMKSLRKYTRSVNMDIFEDYDWINTRKDLSFVGDYLDKTRIYSLVTPQAARRFPTVDHDVYNASLLGADKEAFLKAGTF